MSLDSLESLLNKTRSDLLRIQEACTRLAATPHDKTANREYYTEGLAKCTSTLERLKKVRRWTDYR